MLSALGCAALSMKKGAVRNGIVSLSWCQGSTFGARLRAAEGMMLSAFDESIHICDGICCERRSQRSTFIEGLEGCFEARPLSWCAANAGAVHAAMRNKIARGCKTGKRALTLSTAPVCSGDFAETDPCRREGPPREVAEAIAADIPRKEAAHPRYTIEPERQTVKYSEASAWLCDGNCKPFAADSFLREWILTSPFEFKGAPASGKAAWKIAI
jgi:hypothetical protein